MSLIVTTGSSSISATVKGTSGITYYVSNGNETTDLLTGETAYFDNLSPSTEYTLTMGRYYKLVKNIRVKGTTQPLSIAEVRAWLWDNTVVNIPCPHPHIVHHSLHNTSSQHMHIPTERYRHYYNCGTTHQYACPRSSSGAGDCGTWERTFP